jgi:ActR/RegA family two-component response regulator
MTDQDSARVLVIDDDERVGPDLKELLAPRGYEVDFVTGYGEELIESAITIAQSFRPHVAVIDFRLTDEDDDSGGFSVSEKMKSACLILYSAFLKVSLTTEARSRGFFLWVEKQNETIEIIQGVDQAAKTKSADRKNFLVENATGYCNRKILESLFGEGTDIPATIIDDVLCQLFQDHQKVLLRPVTGDVTTPRSLYSRSSVFRAWREDQLIPVIVKLAPDWLIKKERKNYFDHIDGNLGSMHHAILLGNRSDEPIIFWDLGGLSYSLIGAPHEEFLSFRKYYRDHTPDDMNLLFQHFFIEVWGGLYRRKQKLEGSLYSAYDGIMNLAGRIQGFANTEAEISFAGVPKKLINPLPWVITHHSESYFPESFSAIIHGDLHGNNLLVFENHAWAIDFERSGPGHYLFDFVELELDIAIQKIKPPEENLVDFYNCAVLLVSERALPQDAKKIDGWVISDECKKAVKVINHLRAIAYEITQFSDFREYLWGLLFNAIFVASILEGIQRDQALLVGAVVCQRLRNWSLKPEEWLSQHLIPVTEQPMPIKKTTGKEVSKMLPMDQEAAIPIMLEAVKFLFSEAGKGLERWRKKKGDSAPKEIEVLDQSHEPELKMDDIQYKINLEVLFRQKDSIESSQKIISRLIEQRNSYRVMWLTGTFNTPKDKVEMEQKINELERDIAAEVERLQKLIDDSLF